MLKTAGIFLLKVAAKHGWNYLKEEDLNSVFDCIFKSMVKENRRYNQIFENNEIFLSEIFYDDEILKSIGEFLVNEEDDLLNYSNFKLIELKINKSEIKKSDINELLEDFQKHLILNLSLNKKIRDNFLVSSVFHLAKGQKQILEILNEGIQIVGDDETDGFTDVGAITQFRILAHSFEDFVQEIKRGIKIKSKSRILILKKISDDEFHSVYQNHSSNKSLEITDSPFKVIYPNISRINIWLKRKYFEKTEIIEISVFCSTPNIVNKLAYLFFSCIPSHGTIQQGEFHKRMKKFVKDIHPHSTYAIKFDPDIVQEIKEAGLSKEIKVTEQTLFGDPGLPRLDEINSVLSKLELNTDGSAKIRFFKAKKDAKIIAGALTTFALSSDGRVLAWFRKDQFSSEVDKYTALYNWYLDNAHFNLITPRKRTII